MYKHISTDELKKVLRDHEKFLNAENDGIQADLSDYDLSGLDLSSVDLSDAIMRRCDLNHSKLAGSNFSGADLSNSNLSDSDLKGCDLSGSSLKNANLSYCDLRHANLGESDLCGANLSDSDLTGSNLDLACWPLSCGTKNVKVDVLFTRQLAAHLCILKCDDAEFTEIRERIIEFARRSHRAEYLKLAECNTQKKQVEQS